MSLSDELRAQSSACVLLIDAYSDDEAARLNLLEPAPPGCTRLSQATLLPGVGYVSVAIQSDELSKFEALAAEAWHQSKAKLRGIACGVAPEGAFMGPFGFKLWLLELAAAAVENRIPVLRRFLPGVNSYLVQDAYRASALLLDDLIAARPVGPISETGVIDERPQRMIPAEHRTRPMTYREAGALARGATSKAERKTAGEWIAKCVNEGTIQSEPSTGQKRIYDIRDFPAAVQDKLRQ